jgi:hypothetical protein
MPTQVRSLSFTVRHRPRLLADCCAFLEAFTRRIKGKRRYTVYVQLKGRPQLRDVQALLAKAYGSMHNVHTGVLRSEWLAASDKHVQSSSKHIMMGQHAAPGRRPRSAAATPAAAAEPAAAAPGTPRPFWRLDGLAGSVPAAPAAPTASLRSAAAPGGLDAQIAGGEGAACPLGPQMMTV